MGIFDEDGNYLGEFIENQSEDVSEAFCSSWIWGLIYLLFVTPIRTILGLLLYAFIKLSILCIKIILKCTWWIVRLPFTLIFEGFFPEF